ncbi:geranylgeranyl reductase family protein [Methanobrevibacter millerae]|uniref:Geranylgeranyl reductase family n=1 Tax=Methanobrevibacter millerae TaxID=230361 RepID=A0A1G5WXS1_9EURY|nr:NAD(P)/FAD-dependent oxidoreductase [Methanobrevibacter millerae]SDA62943.1 geranylgeranyl reductase family [Methanobrevibacter millerae]
MNYDYDAVIVGAGPVGSTIAFYLTQNDLNVVMLEKKTRIGYPLQCAGILSKHIFEYNELPEEIILNTVNGAFLHSKNNILNVRKDENAAYIIDRIAYDQFLLNRAIQNGVELINKKVVDVDVEKGIAYFSDKQSITSRVIIGCDGYKSIVSKSMGNKQKNFNASQMLVEINDKNLNNFTKSNGKTDDYVGVYLSEDTLPGFIWVIPLQDNKYRVGLFSEDSHIKQGTIITNFLNENFEYEIIEKYKGFIPVFNKENHLVKNRAILIGDSASQIKPTSGGGLIMAFDSCKIAGGYITDAIKKDNIQLLKGYQKEFNKRYSKEFNYQFKVQNVLNSMDDDDLDYFFEILKENDYEKIISEYGDMDNQSEIIKEFLKRGLAFKFISNVSFFKKVVNIFGIR